MDNLYNIQEELLGIFREIEDNDGVVDNEILNRLQITEEEFKEKLESYQKARLTWKGNVEVIKEEVKRLTERKKVFENRIERLGNVMKDAVIMFGDDGKSGNKVIELPTFKLFTKSTQSTDVKEERIQNLINYVVRFVKEMYDTAVITLGDTVDPKGLLTVINANGFAEHGAMFVPYTISDLISIEVEITNKTSLFDLITQENSMLPTYLQSQQAFVINPNLSKEHFKFEIERVKGIEDHLTVAGLNHNISLQVK
jgi:hypothetical protein